MTQILKATPISEVTAELNGYLRALVLIDRARMDDANLSLYVGVAYHRLRRWMNNADVMANEADLTALLKRYMPEYKYVPAMIVPANEAA